jgi:glucose dehydrogenase
MRFAPLGLLALALVAQSNQSGEWRHYSRDLANSRYSPLDLVTGENIGSVRAA